MSSRSLKKLLEEQHSSAPAGSTLGKRAFLQERPPQQLPLLSSGNNSSSTGRAGRVIERRNLGPTTWEAGSTLTLLPRLRCDSPVTKKKKRGNEAWKSPREEEKATVVNRAKEEEEDAPTTSRLPPRSRGEIAGSAALPTLVPLPPPPPARRSSNSSTSSSIGPRHVTSSRVAGASSPESAVRGDLQEFVDQLLKDGKTNPQLNLPQLLAAFLPKVGLGTLESGRRTSTRTLESPAPSSSGTPFSEGSNAFFTLETSPLTPFVSHMSFNGVTGSEIGDPSGGEFQPATLEGALLFLDISGYSAVCSALQGKGAHAISHAVNSYMERILSIVVGEFHGDVLKFAGDAVMVTWTYEADMERSCLSAALCALKLQARCGMHIVESEKEDQKLSFAIHIGLTAGTFHSDIFQPKFNASMQRAYHFVHGTALNSSESIVDAARAGEVCCGVEFQKLTEGSLLVTTLSEVDGNTDTGNEGIFRVESVTGDGHAQLARLEMDSDCTGDYGPILPDRPPGAEAQFIHPSIVKKLQFGIKPNHLAEMRLLCVLFIHKTNKDASVADWFYESQEILDAQRCPIVQIIQDDKGVHLVAAVNLFVAETNPTMVGLATARALKEREVECTIGMATGVTFCGIVGSADACRWDITGSACVRAARLMQFASNDSKANGVKIIIDQSLKERCTDFTQLREVASDVKVKGTSDPIPVYTLNDNTNEVTSRILMGSRLVDDVLRGTFDAMVSAVSPRMENHSRGVGVLSGPIGCGKKKMALRVAVQFQCITILHATTRGAASLAVAKTIADWYEHHVDTDLSELSKRIKLSFHQNFVSRTMHLALELVDLTLSKDISTCLIVHHAHFLDSYSLSLLQQIHSADEQIRNEERSGRWLTMLTHYPLYGSPTALKLAQVISRDKAGKGVPIVPMGQFDLAQQHSIFQNGIYIFEPIGVSTFVDRAGGNIGFSIASGGFMGKAYFENIMKAKITGEPIVEFTKCDTCGRGEILRKGEDVINETPWTEISPELVSRITQQYDVLPPRHQMVLRVLAAVTRQDFLLKAPLSLVTAITLQLVSRRSAREISHDVKLLSELLILNIEETTVSFTSPAMRDMVDSLLTPGQAQTINKRCALLYSCPPFYQEDSPVKLLTLARFLRHGSGANSAHVLSTNSAAHYLDSLRLAWQIVMPRVLQSLDADQTCTYDTCELSKELGFEVKYVEGLGSLEPLGVPKCEALRYEAWFSDQDTNAPRAALQPSMDPTIVKVKNYTAPLGLGPLAKVLSAIAIGLMSRYFEASRLEAGEEEGVRGNGVTFKDVSQYAFDLISVYMAGIERFEEIVPQADSRFLESMSGDSSASTPLLTPADSGVHRPPDSGPHPPVLTLAEEGRQLQAMLAPGQSAARYSQHAEWFLTDYAVNTVDPRAARAATWMSSPDVRLPPVLENNLLDVTIPSEEEQARELQRWIVRRAFDCLTTAVTVKQVDATPDKSPLDARLGKSPLDARLPSSRLTSFKMSSSTSSTPSITKLELDDSKFHESLMCLAVENWRPILPALLAEAPIPASSHAKHIPVKEKLHELDVNATTSMVEWIRDAYLQNQAISLAEYRAFLYLYCMI